MEGISLKTIVRDILETLYIPQKEINQTNPQYKVFFKEGMV
jgi:hypothetical protein